MLGTIDFIDKYKGVLLYHGKVKSDGINDIIGSFIVYPDPKGNTVSGNMVDFSQAGPWKRSISKDVGGTKQRY
ncbi:hypothetical protein UA38_20425 [Photobacterium kishitanii]|uniref:Uncharacterized protein n=1 Tax=Photobacterium kishitanii TaxID=318456 RepID=A0AAX0YZB1_9GAMM|nr:hypothetical protein [Photobacterium kishitanii]KJG55303.1 hypothetical protein UA38_20425 [Photobacterium kishitanii]KJG58417.1 hypothetical protein UA42_19830 [Photobacterium kishitanii]KJG63859.1 hypothetical protein UA40_19835 [Photobacterium kishitanii]KJG67348.1 hypothetical protein UA41_19410 [Photobacterium kishitanii]PSX19242.1 hypothetical protein C0W70_12300 [Photobacterium kishitanii]